ncbi:hypothetical protein [Parvularcula marina]|uniref:PepSY domain-containing protein n=1 Tax=Parvularcula marina TaxID=2292771 RepID=A0A371RIG0_9PROT|nr:hypothetical protein [Parvularcula marina]RFB05231.1 hypothetical protein DX908_08165 [Parvularcula marina]
MFIRSTLIAGAALIAAASAPAHANTQEEVELCLAALSQEAPDAKFSFKRKSGGALAKLKFEMVSADGEKKSVVCKVRKGEVEELDMDA